MLFYRIFPIFHSKQLVRNGRNLNPLISRAPNFHRNLIETEIQFDFFYRVAHRPSPDQRARSRVEFFPKKNDWLSSNSCATAGFWPGFCFHFWDGTTGSHGNWVPGRISLENVSPSGFIATISFSRTPEKGEIKAKKWNQVRPPRPLNGAEFITFGSVPLKPFSCCSIVRCSLLLFFSLSLSSFVSCVSMLAAELLLLFFFVVVVVNFQFGPQWQPAEWPLRFPSASCTSSHCNRWNATKRETRRNQKRARVRPLRLMESDSLLFCFVFFFHFGVRSFVAVAAVRPFQARFAPEFGPTYWVFTEFYRVLPGFDVSVVSMGLDRSHRFSQTNLDEIFLGFRLDFAWCAPVQL